MRITNIYQAKTNLSQLIEQAINGQDVIIGKANKPVAKLVAFHQSSKPRQPGAWKGKVKISKNFDQLPKNIAKYFQDPQL